MSNNVINQTEAYIYKLLPVYYSFLTISNLHRNLRFSTLYAYITNNFNKFYICILETSQNPRFHENLKTKTQKPESRWKPQF